MPKQAKKAKSTRKKKAPDIAASISEVAEAVVEVYSAELPKGKTLDFSESSLKTLDQLISSLWGSDGPSEENQEAMIWALGCYVGEVLQRNYSGVWNDGDDGPFFEGMKSGSGVSPWSWIAKRFEFGTDETVIRKYTLAKKLLSADKK